MARINRDLTDQEYNTLSNVVLCGFYESKGDPTLDALHKRGLLHRYPNGFAMTMDGIRAVDMKRRQEKCGNRK